MICPLRTPNRPRKVRLVSFPPVGETCVRSLARPFPASPQAPYPSLPPLAKAHPFRCGSSPHKSAAFAGAPAIRFSGLLRGPITGASVGVRPPLSGGKIDTWAVPRRAPPWCRQTCQSSAPPWAAWRGIALKGPRPPGLVPADGFSFFPPAGTRSAGAPFLTQEKEPKVRRGRVADWPAPLRAGLGQKAPPPGPPVKFAGVSVPVHPSLSGARDRHLGGSPTGSALVPPGLSNTTPHWGAWLGIGLASNCVYRVQILYRIQIPECLAVPRTNALR